MVARWIILGAALSLLGGADALDKCRDGIHDKVNELRAKGQLEALGRDAKLDAAAQKHAENMARHEKSGHELDGKRVKDRIKVEGYEARGGTGGQQPLARGGRQLLEILQGPLRQHLAGGADPDRHRRGPRQIRQLVLLPGLRGAQGQGAMTHRGSAQPAAISAATQDCAKLPARSGVRAPDSRAGDAGNRPDLLGKRGRRAAGRIADGAAES
jgi:Cysteine-rich secretory protein family